MGGRTAAQLSSPEVRDLRLKEILTSEFVHGTEVLLRSQPVSGLFTGFQTLHFDEFERDTVSVAA